MNGEPLGSKGMFTVAQVGVNTVERGNSFGYVISAGRTAAQQLKFAARSVVAV